VIECGVCGTDHDIAEGKYGRSPEGSPFLILGHENLGRVLEVAPGAAGFGVGDLVVATVAGMWTLPVLSDEPIRFL